MTNRNDPINSVVQTSTSPYGGERMECTDGGLTKREYFASMALQGMVSRMGIDTSKDKSFVVENSVKYADMLIEQLNK